MLTGRRAAQFNSLPLGSASSVSSSAREPVGEARMETRVTTWEREEGGCDGGRVTLRGGPYKNTQRGLTGSGRGV